jgi:hypothetical protein
MISNNEVDFDGKLEYLALFADVELIRFECAMDVKSVADMPNGCEISILEWTY